MKVQPGSYDKGNFNKPQYEKPIRRTKTGDFAKKTFKESAQHHKGFKKEPDPQLNEEQLLILLQMAVLR